MQKDKKQHPRILNSKDTFDVKFYSRSDIYNHLWPPYKKKFKGETAKITLVCLDSFLVT